MCATFIGELKPRT